MLYKNPSQRCILFFNLTTVLGGSLQRCFLRTVPPAVMARTRALAQVSTVRHRHSLILSCRIGRSSKLLLLTLSISRLWLYMSCHF